MKSLAILIFGSAIVFLFSVDRPFLYLIPYGIGFDENISGRWISANESVLSVNINSGKSDAVGEGTTQGKDK